MNTQQELQLVISAQVETIMDTLDVPKERKDEVQCYILLGLNSGVEIGKKLTSPHHSFHENTHNLAISVAENHISKLQRLNATWRKQQKTMKNVNETDKWKGRETKNATNM